MFRVGQRPAAAKSDELPKDLKPRVELFARAWLGGDVPKMRRLAVASQDRAVYGWFLKHPPPSAAAGGAGKKPQSDEARVETSDLPGGGKRVLVKLALPGLAADGKPGVELTQVWEGRGDSWYFVPDAVVR